MGEAEKKPLDCFVDFVYEATRIFRGVHMAFDLKKFLLALAAIIVWVLGALVINLLMDYPIAILIAAGLAATGLILAVYSKSEAEFTRTSIVVLVGSLLVVWAVVITLYFVLKDLAAPSRSLIFHPLWALAVAAFFGTAISRIAAVWAATEDNVSFSDAARFALNKLATSIWTLLFPAAAVLAFGIFLICIGVPGRIGIGVGWVWYNVIIGVTYILWLIGGLCFALVFLMYIPGLALFQPAIAAEGEDAFGAFSSVYGFILQKPWRLAFYGVMAYVYGRIVLTVAACVVILAGKITNTFLAWGVGDTMQRDLSKLDIGSILGGSFLSIEGPGVRAFEQVFGRHVSESFSGIQGGGWFIIIWQYLLLALFMAFAVSLFYCLATQIYFLMRKSASGTPFEEVYIEEPEEEEFAAEFAEAPKPAEVKKPTLEDLADKAATKAKAQDEADKPIDLAGSDRPLED